MTRRISSSVAFTGEKFLRDAVIEIEGGRIAAVTGADNPVKHQPGESGVFPEAVIVPGFIDIQVNGGGGVLFNNQPDLDAINAIADAHVRFGTTRLLPTLISDGFDVIRAAIAAVGAAVDDDDSGIIGIHLEGPFLNAERKGAHNPEKFNALNRESVKLLTSLKEPAVTLITLAPEVNALDHIARLVEAGAIVFAGHTAASFDCCMDAERIGVSGYTHLFNAMTPMGSREPGVVGAAIASRKSVFTIIADGHHCHPGSFKIACRAKWKGGCILVTDAMPTVGSEEGQFQLEGELITLNNGVLRNASGSLAGSNLTMIDAIRNACTFADIDWFEAVRMATVYPARALGVEDRFGRIVPGASADFVELVGEMEISRVWRAGRLVVDNSRGS